MKKILMILLAACLLMLVSCIQYDQVFNLDKDGSGSVSIHYAMSSMMVQQMKAMSEMAGQMAEGMGAEGQEPKKEEEMNIFEFQEDKIKKEFEDLKNEGFKLTDLKTYQEEGWEHVKLSFTFKDVSKITKVSYFKDNDMTITKNAKGNYVIRSKTSKEEKPEETAETPGDAPPMEGMDDESMKQMMMPMMKGFRVSITFNTPTPIVHTTAPEKGKTMAKWEFDLEKDMDAMDKMEDEEMVIEFKGKGVKLNELK